MNIASNIDHCKYLMGDLINKYIEYRFMFLNNVYIHYFSIFISIYIFGYFFPVTKVLF